VSCIGRKVCLGPGGGTLPFGGVNGSKGTNSGTNSLMEDGRGQAPGLKSWIGDGREKSKGWLVESYQLR